MAERVVMAAAVEQRQGLRDELSAPVLDGIRAWVTETLPRQVPGSASHAALQYVDNQWDRLRVFLNEPQIACHNNNTERDLGRPVKGRDNWHFAGSPRGARAAAMYYSLIGTCLLQGIDPRRYLVEILGRLDEPPANSPRTRSANSGRRRTAPRRAPPRPCQQWVARTPSVPRQLEWPVEAVVENP